MQTLYDARDTFLGALSCTPEAQLMILCCHPREVILFATRIQNRVIFLLVDRRLKLIQLGIQFRDRLFDRFQSLGFLRSNLNSRCSFTEIMFDYHFLRYGSLSSFVTCPELRNLDGIEPRLTSKGALFAARNAFSHGFNCRVLSH